MYHRGVETAYSLQSTPRPISSSIPSLVSNSKFSNIKVVPTLAGIAQWIEDRPTNQRATSWIPSLGHTAWVAAQVTSRAYVRGNYTLMFLPFSSSSINLKKKKKKKHLVPDSLN